MIVVDAGSSHTGLYVYQYQKDLKTGLPIDIKTAFHSKVKPGIENIKSDAQTVANYLTPLVSGIPTSVPTHTPVYFYATAGMRLVSQDQQQQTYQSIKHWLENNTQYDIKKVATVSGQWEGAFDWLAVNYLIGDLQSNKSTAAVLDMGGASTEIAYEMKESTNAQSQDLLSLKLGSRNIQLYSHSYLGLGQDQARNQFANDAACFPVNYQLPNGYKAKGKFALCQRDTARLINAVHHVARQTPHNMPANMPVYVISGYHSEAVSKPIGLGNEFTPYQLESKGEAVCGTDWQSLTKQDVNDPFLFQLCFNAAYHSSLLTKGYGLAEDQSVIQTSTINGNDIDWTLGVLIYNAQS